MTTTLKGAPKMADETMTPEVEEHTEDKDGKTTDRSESWMRVRFPRGAVHPYEFKDKNGKTWDKGIVNIPDDADHPIKINGVNIAGYSFDTFLTSHQLSQIANGGGATISFKPGQTVELFKGKDDARKTLALEPGPLAHAIKVYREEYAASKLSEREKDNGPEKEGPEKKEPGKEMKPEKAEVEKVEKPGKTGSEKEAKPARADVAERPKGTSLNERGKSAKAIREAKAADVPPKALAHQPQGHL
jgi:hypothetical protein